MVSVLGALVVPTVSAPKAKVPGLSATGSSPAPLRLMVCGLLMALSEIVTIPVCEPLVFGANVTVMVHCAPAAMLVPQVFTWLNAAPVTEILMLVRLTD